MLKVVKRIYIISVLLLALTWGMLANLAWDTLESRFSCKMPVSWLSEQSRVVCDFLHTSAIEQELRARGNTLDF